MIFEFEYRGVPVWVWYDNTRVTAAEARELAMKDADSGLDLNCSGGSVGYPPTPLSTVVVVWGTSVAEERPYLPLE